MKPVRFFLGTKQMKRNINSEYFFTTAQNLDVSLSMDIDYRKLDLQANDPTQDIKDFYEVKIILKIQEPQNLYQYECEYMGLFEFDKNTFSEEEIQTITNIHCPSMIYPYLRVEVERDLITSGLPPVLLPPINFATIYNQKKSS